MRDKTAADTLREWAKYMDWQSETFNTLWSMDELRKLLTFAFSEQGKHVHECMDSWPQYLIDAVLAAPEGAAIDPAIVTRAGEEAA